MTSLSRPISSELFSSSERVDSYVSTMAMTRTVTSAIPLLNLQNDDETKPLLPLSSSDPLAFENSPFASLRPWGPRTSEVVSDLLGPGPWPVRVVLRLPADCGLLHPTSRGRVSSIHITHALRFTMRLARGDDAAMDTRTNKRKLFDVVVRSPVHILSVRCPLSIPSLSTDLRADISHIHIAFTRTVLRAHGVYRAAALL
jgi:hypothetical protein